MIFYTRIWLTYVDFDFTSFFRKKSIKITQFEHVHSLLTFGFQIRQLKWELSGRNRSSGQRQVSLAETWDKTKTAAAPSADWTEVKWLVKTEDWKVKK